MAGPDPLLDVASLTIRLDTGSGPLDLVRGLDLRLNAGDVLGIVGESGSGKSLTALSLIGLLPPSTEARGTVRFASRDLVGLPEADWGHLRGRRIGFVFQEPMSSLNPLHPIGAQVAEPLLWHGLMDRAAARAEAVRLIDRVGIPRAADPHELSGGQRQRVMIAMAIACRPDLLIADEPTSALDATVQRQIVALLRDLQAERGMAMIVISHDLGVIADLASRTLVLYGGRRMETGPTTALFRAPAHPYTRGLIAARPGRHLPRGTRLAAIPGQVPAPADLPPGCPFHGRCAIGTAQCRDHVPPLRIIGASEVACHHAEGETAR